jgi:pyridoxamine 5'-phosphate oxidase-like protein
MTTAEKDAELREMARQVIDHNRYLVLGTIEPDGGPRLSPVFYTPAGYRDFYWVSSPEAQHSRNLAERPDVQIVIFDSSVAVGQGQAVYMSTLAREVAPDELPSHLGDAFDPATRDGVAFTVDELSGQAELRLYVATATAYDVHVPGGHPTLGRGIDARCPTDPTA